MLVPQNNDHFREEAITKKRFGIPVSLNRDTRWRINVCQAHKPEDDKHRLAAVQE